MSPQNSASTHPFRAQSRHWGEKGKPESTSKHHNKPHIPHTKHKNTRKYKTKTHPKQNNKITHYFQQPENASDTTQAHTTQSNAPPPPPEPPPETWYDTSNKAERFGDPLEEDKPTQHLRFVFMNLNRLPISKADPKSSQLLENLKKYHIDVLMLAEVGLCWNNIPMEDRWAERTYKGPLAAHRYKFGYNVHASKKTKKKVQWGGTGILSLHDTVHRTPQSGTDPSGLGRWTWTRIQGREGFWLRVVSAYRPVHNTTELGSTYQQHLRFLRSRNKRKDPRDQFLIDLKQQLQQWLLLGDNIMVGIDANEDVRHGDTHSMFHDLGLHDLILHHHHTLIPPETCAKNNHNIPIDSIFVSPGLTMTQGGYGQYGEVGASDHRCLWADISFETALGHKAPHLHHRPPKRLKANDPVNRARYIALVLEEYKNEDDFVPKQAAKLREMLADKADPAAIESVHHNLITADKLARSKAEHKVRQIPSNHHAWSPEWKTLRDRELLWRTVVRRFTKHQVKGRYLSRLMRRCNNHDAFRISEEEAKRRLEYAEMELRAVCDNATALREEYLNRLIEEKARANNTSAATEIKRIKKDEQQRKTFRRLRAIKSKGKGLATKLFTMQDGEEVACETQESIVEVSQIVNETRFTNALESPLLKPPLLDLIGHLAEGPAVDSILEGTFVPPEETDQYTKLVLLQLKIPEALRDIPPFRSTITADDNVQSWKRQKEHTAADPHGLSFSHHIAGAYDTTIAEVDAVIRSAPLETAFVPLEWQTMTDCSIPKKKNVLQASKMRTICLMNSQFNMNNKAMGRRLMAHNEFHGTIAEEQAGSRKRHRSALVALNKVLSLDILRQNKQAGFICSNDALQCYDRIIHALVALGCRRLGMSEEAIDSLIRALAEAEHYIMTGYGVSNTTYGGHHRRRRGLLPLQGIMQGNGMGPTFWVAISTVLIEIMRNQGFGAYFIGALTLTYVAFTCYAFVDDTDLIHTAKDNLTSALTILPEFQSAVDCWAGILQTTGGDLEPSKSFWGLIDFKWNGTTWAYQDETDAPGEISIYSAAQKRRVPLERISMHESRMTLGVEIAYDGNQEGEIQHLRNKATEFANQYRTASLEKNDAWIGIKTGILSTFRYPHAATQLTEKEWDYVCAPVFQMGLPKSGISRMFPRAVLFGPMDYQGLDVVHPFHEQELEHLCILVQESNDSTLTGGLLNKTFQDFRLELGLPGFLTDWNFDTYGESTTTSWLKTLWHYCSNQGIHIGDPIVQLALTRDNDCFLMSAFAAANFTPKELRILNICRIYLQVVTLTDICTVDGKSITEEAYTGVRSQHKIHNYNWPKPPPYLSQSGFWNLWQKALTKCFIRNTTRTRLWHPLGTWLVDPGIHWPWMFHEDTGTLYNKVGPQQWRKYIPTFGIARAGRTFHDDEQTLDAPPRACRAATIYPSPIPHRVSLVSFSHHTFHPPDPTPIPTSVHEAIAQLPAADQWALAEVNTVDNGAHIAAAIIRRKARAISDGSFKTAHGTSGFSFHGYDTTKQITGANQVPGAPDDQCAYRSELAGVVAIVTLLGVLCSFHSIEDGHLELGLDGESVIKRLTQKSPPKISIAHYDMIRDCRERITALPIKITFRWIEGHQDDKGKHLDWWALRNIEMDTKAKHYWSRTFHGPHLPNHPFSHEGWSVRLNEDKLSTIDKAQIYSRLHTVDIKAYWQRKHAINDENWNNIHWEASKQALKAQPLGLQRWFAKHSTGHCAVGRMMLLRREWNHSRCPQCGEANETTLHVLRCPSPKARTQWKTSIAKLTSWMKTAKTDPMLQLHILAHLRSWSNSRIRQVPRIGSPIIRQALVDQNNIGWSNFMLGRVSRRFSEAQELYYRFLKNRKTGKRWTIALITKLQEVAWDMWQHRNHILHNEPHPSHHGTELEEANSQIAQEVAQGDMTLLRQDQFLLSAPDDLPLLSLEEKFVWLEAIAMAREAYTIDANAAHANLQQQRDLLANWLN